VLVLLSLIAAAAPTADPGLLLEGATVYASAAAKARTASVLVRDGRVVFVG